jgi:hypothetical protein
LAGSRAVIDANADRRPALVTVEYRIAPERRDTPFSMQSSWQTEAPTVQVRLNRSMLRIDCP